MHEIRHYFIFFFWSCHEACEILVSWPEIESKPSAVNTQSPNHLCVHAKSFQLCPLFATLWTIACWVPLSMGFVRPLGDHPKPGNESVSFMSPASAGRFFTTSATWEVSLTTDRQGIPLFHCFLMSGLAPWTSLIQVKLFQAYGVGNAFGAL